MKLRSAFIEWASSLKVGTRLAVGFGSILMFVAALGVVGTFGMHHLNESISNIVTFKNAKLAFANTMGRSLVEQEKSLFSLLLAESSEQRDQAAATLEYQSGQYNDAKAGYEELMGLDTPTEMETKLVAKLLSHENLVRPLATRAVELVAADDTEAAMKLIQSEVRPAFKKWGLEIDELSSIMQRMNDKAATTATKEYTQLRNFLLACVAFAFVLGTALSYLLTRGLHKELGGEPRVAADLARAVAQGDLSVPINLRPGDITSLMSHLKSMQGNLSDIVHSVRQSSESVAIASAQIAQGNNDLSQRTEQQASALEETAASIDQLGSIVKQNAGNATHANQLAMDASNVAIEGGDVVGKVVQTMKSINESSKKIVDIISVIDGIAFQTNILALNAAVEAARAGEQGRGFAVVASEVRSLAGRSAEAAKQIKALIAASVERVEQGTTMVDQAGTTMNKVVASIKSVTDIMGEISTASSQQASGVAQVGEAVSQMDQATQQNAALVEQSAAAAESLQGQAEKLVQTVAVFKLANSDSFQVASA